MAAASSVLEVEQAYSTLCSAETISSSHPLLPALLQLRRLLVLLPAALDRDQPGSKHAIRARLLQLPACQAALPSQPPSSPGAAQPAAQLQRMGTLSHWELLRGSVLQRASQRLLGGGGAGAAAAERQRQQNQRWLARGGAPGAAGVVSCRRALAGAG